MELNEEKKLVAEKLLGKEVFLKSHREDRMNRNPNKFDYCTDMGFLADWRISSDDLATFKDWAEIFEKMDDNFTDKYITHLENEILKGRPPNELENDYEFLLHMVPPSIRWKALIKTLEA